MKKQQYLQDCCTGCGLCHSIKGINFVVNEKGFPIPNIDNINEDYFEKVCPVFHYTSQQSNFNLWGEYKAAYSGYSSNQEIRHQASSGGALTELSIYLLESNMVDGIIHTGVKVDNPMETQTYCSTTIEDIIKRCGSRYGVSTPLMDLNEFIEEGKRYAFIGKPCDVAALKRYMEIDTTLKKNIAITMSFFCAGTPSKTANDALLDRLACPKNKLIQFNYRGNGWPGYATATDDQGNKYSVDYKTAWGAYLGRDVRKICRYCMDGIGELADIVCADLWHLDKEMQPDFSEYEGRNIIICRTDDAIRIVKLAVNKGRLVVDSYDNMDTFHKVQPYQFERRVTMKYRILAAKLFHRFSPKYNPRLLKEANKYATDGMNWKIFKGSVRRILGGKL